MLHLPSEKRTQKRSKKRSASQAAKTVSGGVGPFKTTKRNIRKVSKLDRWIKHAQTSLKARWRIYIYIYIYISEPHKRSKTSRDLPKTPQNQKNAARPDETSSPLCLSHFKTDLFCQRVYKRNGVRTYVFIDWSFDALKDGLIVWLL